MQLDNGLNVIAAPGMTPDLPRGGHESWRRPGRRRQSPGFARSACSSTCLTGFSSGWRSCSLIALRIFYVAERREPIRDLWLLLQEFEVFTAVDDLEIVPEFHNRRVDRASSVRQRKNANYLRKNTRWMLCG